MTFDEAIRWPALRRAAHKVLRRFKHVPGFYLAFEDLKQAGALSAWKLGARLDTMDEPLLYRTLLCDIHDYARSSVDFPRSRQKANDFPAVLSLEFLREAGYHPKDKKASPFDVARASETEALVTDKRCRMTPKEKIAARLFFLEDHTKREIATMMGVCPSRITQLIQTAAAKMRRVRIPVTG